MSDMGNENARQFDEWYARNHPFDWFTKELGEPVATEVRLKVWSLARAAWFHTEAGINCPDQARLDELLTAEISRLRGLSL